MADARSAPRTIERFEGPFLKGITDDPRSITEPNRSQFVITTISSSAPARSTTVSSGAPGMKTTRTRGISTSNPAAISPPPPADHGRPSRSLAGWWRDELAFAVASRRTADVRGFAWRSTGLWSGGESPTFRIQRGGRRYPISAQAFTCMLMWSGFEPRGFPAVPGTYGCISEAVVRRPRPRITSWPSYQLCPRRSNLIRVFDGCGRYSCIARRIWQSGSISTRSSKATITA